MRSYGRETLNVHIPIARRLNQRAIGAIARCKNEVQTQIYGKRHDNA